jgi:hypothetical protein
MGDRPVPHDAYPVGSGFLWRWVDLPQDDAMAAFVLRYAVAGDEARERLRSALSTDDLYTLLLFSRRSALRAIRTGDAGAAELAADALALAPVGRNAIDSQNVGVAEALAAYAGQRVVLGHADPGLARAAGLREVAGPDGPVLVEDRFQRYHPSCDLALVALRATALVDADVGYQAMDVAVADAIADVWLRGGDEPPRAALRAVTGCASVHGAPPVSPAVPDGTHFLLIYLAEAATAADAATIAGAAGVRHGGAAAVGAAVGRLCAIVIGARTPHGPPAPESAASLARFVRPLTELLAGA